MPIPLELFAEVTAADGTRYRWDANQAPGSRLQGLTFRTKLGEGFSDASGQLARRIDLDYPDVQLVNSVTFVGVDGTVAYEGRISAMPRELTDRHSVGVQMAGWMAHAKDRKFTEVYVDRDLGAWEPMSRGRKLSLLGSNFSVNDPAASVDPSNNQSGISTGFGDAWVSPYTPITEAWYDAGPGNLVGAIAYSWRIETPALSSANASWFWQVGVGVDDMSNTSSTGNLRAAGPGSGVYTPATGLRFGWLQLQFTTTGAGTAGARYSIGWYKLAVYGDHGLTLAPGDPSEPAGVTASDVITDLATRFCPELDPSGVQATSYSIPHLAFKDRTFPYDAFLEVNKYHLWHIGVWENKTLTFRPHDLRDYTWEIRTDDPGTTFSPQGPSTEDLHNGIVVVYTDLLSGKKETLTPENTTDLADTSQENPWNQAGIQNWAEAELSSPTLAAQATQLGRALLNQMNTAKNPGTITVKGYIRDRAGNQHPVWRVRAGDTIALTNFPNDRPRLIHETSYDDESKVITISVDGPAQAMDAVFDRISLALSAAGLGSIG